MSRIFRNLKHPLNEVEQAHELELKRLEEDWRLADLGVADPSLETADVDGGDMSMLPAEIARDQGIRASKRHNGEKEDARRKIQLQSFHAFISRHPEMYDLHAVQEIEEKIKAGRLQTRSSNEGGDNESELRRIRDEAAQANMARMEANVRSENREELERQRLAEARLARQARIAEGKELGVPDAFPRGHGASTKTKLDFSGKLK